MSSSNNLKWIVAAVVFLGAVFALLLARSGPSDRSHAGPLVIYSGRSQDLIGPLLEEYRQVSGQAVEVRYGKTAQMAATILEEGKNSPADVFIAQDAGAMGALARKGALATLPDKILRQVPERFRSQAEQWVGVSGRARVVVYNRERLSEEDLPDTIFGFTDPSWKGRIGWAPANGSFQAFVTALRVTEGEEKARDWLEGIRANEPRAYPKNTPIVAATAAGEIDVGFVNHYYLYRFLTEEGDSFPARNAFLRGGGPGTLINVAGVARLNTSTRIDAAHALIEFLLGTRAQTYFTTETYEYPLVPGVPPNPAVPPIEDINTPDLDLSDLDDLEGTLALLQDIGIL